MRRCAVLLIDFAEFRAAHARTRRFPNGEVFLMDCQTSMSAAEPASAAALQGFEQVMEFYMPMVYRIAFSRLKNREEAEDITQDVFLRLYRANPVFDGEEHRKAWLIRCAVNRANSVASSARFRHRASAEGLENTDDSEGESTADLTSQSFEQAQRRSSVLDAVARLPEKYRVVIHLFYFEDMPIAQISRALGTKESTIKSQLSRARALLKPLLGEEVEF